MKSTIAPLIPAYNLSSAQITRIIEGLPKDYETPTIVYNDQDTHLHEYLDSLKTKGRVQVVYIPFQVGKAEAVRHGLQALLKTSTAQIIVQIDGRAKQPLEEVFGVVQKLIETGSHIAVGNRYKLQDMRDQVHRKTISCIFSAILESTTGIKLQDTVCGLRAYIRELAVRFCYLRSFGYGLEIEQLLITATHGMTVIDCPVQSNRQEDATNAEKIEDNLYTLINYGHELKMSDNIRAVLCFMLVKLKQRQIFEVDLSAFGRSEQVRFNYVGANKTAIGGYTNQAVIDSYFVSAT